ncbi:MAG: YjfB family protein [Burkholderiales bacterium]|nr:YjfB family protein [Burkholderiales bacterium]
MDVSAIARASNTLADVGVSQQVSIAVLKKALDVLPFLHERRYDKVKLGMV